MAKVYFFLQFFIAFITIQYAFSEEEDVLEFSDSDFEFRITDHDTALVLFYAPWCGHCTSFKPEFAKAATDLKRNDPPISSIQVNCIETGVKTCDKYSINIYPSIKIFLNGKYHMDYEGSREAKDLVIFIKAKVSQTLKELKSISDLGKTLSFVKESAVIGFFDTKSDLYAAFVEVAEKLRMKCQFAYSSEKEVLDYQGISDGVVLFRPLHLRNKFEPDSVTYSGTAKMSEIKQFIIKNFHGLVGVRTLGTQKDFTHPLIVAYFAVDYEKNSKRTNYWRNRVLLVAQEFKGKVNFAISPINEFSEELEDVGIEDIESEKPVVVAIDSGDKKSVFKEDFSVEALRHFVILLLNERVKGKSEAVPEAQVEPVMIAVAKNFEEVVLHNGKDTLIHLYAPWCDHSKKLASILEELAEMLSNEEIAIVKINADANDIPLPYKVLGYPTLYWALKAKKESPVKYDAERSVGSFIKYIAHNATSELRGWDRSGNPKTNRIEL